MVKRYIAAGCSNTNSDGLSLFQFPRDPSLRMLWTREVQRTIANWQGPSDYSVLCSDHFTNDCFEEDMTSYCCEIWDQKMKTSETKCYTNDIPQEPPRSYKEAITTTWMYKP